MIFCVTGEKGSDVLPVSSCAACLPHAVIIFSFTHVAYLIISATMPGNYNSYFAHEKLIFREVKHCPQGCTASELGFKPGSV